MKTTNYCEGKIYLTVNAYYRHDSCITMFLITVLLIVDSFLYCNSKVCVIKIFYSVRCLSYIV